MSTPESKVKQKVKKILDSYGEINKIQESQGHAYVIDENNIDTVNDILSSLRHDQLLQKETYADTNNRF